ncbi:MAG: hypothetical protein Q8R83_09310 [Legionellaceae bacterium]|nr:hypothetical protein [Legionellaceae bacterium]
MLTDSYIKSLKIGDKKRHAYLYGLVLELRLLELNQIPQPIAPNISFIKAGQLFRTI